MKKTAIIFTLASYCLCALAGDYQFLAQPNSKSKVAFHSKALNDIAPIYFSKDHWVKVGNKKNGEVGWIKQTALHDLARTNALYQQKFHHHKNGKNQKGDETFEYIGPKLITEAQAQQMAHKMLKRQAAMRHHMQQMMQSIDLMFAEAENDLWPFYPNDRIKKITSTKHPSRNKASKTKE